MSQNDTNVAAAVTFSALRTSVQDFDFQYPGELNAKAKKAFKLKVLRDNPETLKADFALEGNNKTMTNFIFFTHNPKAWHTAVCQSYKYTKRSGISKGWKVTVHEDSELNSPYLTISIFHNGTVMAQGSENSLENFHQSFKSLRDLANKKCNELNPGTPGKITSSIRHMDDSLTPRNEHVSPRIAINLNSIKENIHTLEREFVEFKDKMLSGSQLQKPPTSQPGDELWTMVRQQREEIKELHAALRELEEDNQDLRMELRRLKEFQLSEQYSTIEALRGEVHELKMNLTILQPPQNPSTPAPTTSSSAVEIEEVKQNSCIPQKTLQKENPPHETKGSDPEIVLLCDSNGKFINMKRLFPSSKAVKIKTPRTSSALENIKKIKAKSLKQLIIHTGTNDFLTSKGNSVVDKIAEVVIQARKTFPQTRISVSTILPRSDVSTHRIADINKEIHQACVNIENVHIIDHEDITSEHLYDTVHLNKKGVSLIAKNMKDTVLQRRKVPTVRKRNFNAPPPPKPPRTSAPPSMRNNRTTGPRTSFAAYPPNYNNQKPIQHSYPPNKPLYGALHSDSMPTGSRLLPGVQTQNLIKPSFASVVASPAVHDLTAHESQFREFVTLLCNKLLY